MSEFRTNGKMMEYDGATGKIQAYLAEPAPDGRFPAIVLIHEIFGLNEHIKSVADRFSRQGYVVLAPHLFSSGYAPKGMTQENIAITMKFFMSIPPEKQRDMEFVQAALSNYDEEKRGVIQSLMGSMFSLPRPKLAEELSAGADFLNDRKNVLQDRIGTAGFCFGGAMSAELACTGKTAASVIFYGQNPEPLDRVKNINGPVLGLYGGMDRRINEHLHELVRALVDSEKTFEIVVYKGAPHAFFNDASPNYREQAAKDAWERVLKFFSLNLGN